jgi:two-component system chemotaxis response regulator CheB
MGEAHRRDIIVIGASAGGVEALTTLVRDLPPDLPAAVFVVHHVPATGTSILPQLLERAGPLSASHARHDEPIRQGRIYVAPADQHMLLQDGHIRLTRGPRENLSRPAVDPLFRSAALEYRSRVIGVILTGALDDGTVGLVSIAHAGGLTIVQDPDEALFSSMPASALRHVAVDHILPLNDIAPMLTRLVWESATEAGAVDMDDHPAALKSKDHMDTLKIASEPDTARSDAPSSYGCPDCGGVLQEIHDGSLTRFRCRIGHAFSAESLLAAQSAQWEGALWAALRALEEKQSLAQRLEKRATDQSYRNVVQRLHEEARAAGIAAGIIRDLLLSQGGGETTPRLEQPTNPS